MRQYPIKTQLGTTVEACRQIATEIVLDPPYPYYAENKRWPWEPCIWLDPIVMEAGRGEGQ